MRKFGILIVAVFFSFGYARAQKSSLLWELNRPGQKGRSYLFGTFHMLCKTDFPFSDLLKQTILGSEQLYEEVNLDDPQLQMNLMQQLMSGKPLNSLIPEAEFARLSVAFKTITGLPLEAFNSFKPFLSLSTLALQSIDCKDRIQPETEFIALAKENRIPIFGLETVKDQIDAIDKEPLDSQLNELKKLVFGFDSVKNTMQQLIQVYKTRDIDSLFSFMKKTGASDDLETNLLENRNKKWIPVMEKAMQEKTVFFAVGAGHLGGTEGLINLLRKRGYTVKPVIF